MTHLSDTARQTPAGALPTSMRAVTRRRYGGPEVVGVETLERPEPAAGELLLRVRAAGLDRATLHLLEGKPYLARLAFGLRRPGRPVLGQQPDRVARHAMGQVAPLADRKSADRIAVEAHRHEVGGAAFAMYTQGDGLWIKNAAEEERMVEAMRKSADLTVKAVSAKGTETIDSFSLKGLAQALDRLGQDCRR